MTRTDSSASNPRTALKDRHLSRHPEVHDRKTHRPSLEREIEEAVEKEIGVPVGESFADDLARRKLSASK